MIKLIIVIVLCVLTTSCVTVAPVVNPNSVISIYGVSSLPPQNGEWLLMVASGYQMTLAKEGTNKSESIVANISIHQLPEFTSDKEFHNYVVKFRNAEPDIGRFENRVNTTNLSSLNGAICIKYHSISTDQNAKVHGGKTAEMILENIGYNCKHPDKNTVGVNIEYSLRHFSETTYESFEKNGNEFFDNVKFTEF